MAFPPIHRWTCALAAASLLAACGSAPPKAASPGLAPGVHQQSTQSPVRDPVAGTPTTRVAFTVFVPETPGPYPLVLIGGGFGEGRTTALPGPDNEPAASYWRRMQRQIPKLLERGHAVISFDYRGHGDSGGDMRLLDPAADMQDLRAIIDWAEAHLNLARRASSTRADDPLVATMGGSYGGAYQLLLAQLDPRIDAIVPTMTWSRLDHSLLPDQVVKHGWLQLECFLGQRGKVRDDGRFVKLCELAKPPQPATLEAVLPADARAMNDYLAGSGWQPWLRQGGKGRPVDALLVQADEDVLFPLNDAFENFRSLQALGGDVRLITVRAGHVNQLAGQKNQAPVCGQAVPDAFDAMLDFLDEKLRGAPRKGALPSGTLCFATGERSAEWRTSLPPDAGPDAPRVELAAVEVAGTQPVFVPLRSALPAGQVLLGAPRAMLDVQGAAPRSVALVGVGLRRAGQAPLLVSGQLTAVRAGPGREVVLPAVAQALQPGDELGVLLWPAHPQFQHMKSVSEPVPVGGVLPGNAVRVSGQVWLPVQRSAGAR